MNNSLNNPVTRPNVVFFALRFFKHNWQVLTTVFLLNITVLYLFNHTFESIFPQLTLNLTTTNTDDLSALAVMDRLNVVNISWLVVKTFVEFFTIAVVTLILKSILDIVIEKNGNIPVTEIKDLQSGIGVKSLLVGFLPVVFSAPMLKLALLAIWRSFQFIIILLLIAVLVNILLFSLGGGVVAVTYIIFRLFSILIPLVVTILVVFRQYSFSDYLGDLKNLFTKRGADLFNCIIFIVFTLVLTPTIMIAIVAITNVIGQALNILAVTNFLNTLVASYLTGFFSDLYLVVVFIMVFFYFESKETDSK